MWQIQMQFIPENNQIWVLKLEPNEPIWEFEIYEEAVEKIKELEKNDTTKRQYKIVKI